MWVWVWVLYHPYRGMCLQFDGCVESKLRRLENDMGQQHVEIMHTSQLMLYTTQPMLLAAAAAETLLRL